MDNLLELKSVWIIIGGLASLFLTVVIKYSLRLKKYDQELKSINRNMQVAPRLRQHYGNVEEWLNNSDEFRKYKFSSELFRHSMQPLIILSILSLVDEFSKISILYLVAVMIFSFIHEIIWAEKLKNNGGYRFVIILFWFLFFIMMLCLEMDHSSNVNKTTDTQQWLKNIGVLVVN